RCISRRLLCNRQRDCSDGSDEEGCQRPTHPCGRPLRPVPAAQLIGSGYNALAGELAGEVLDNTFYGKDCNTVSEHTIDNLYRMPSNLLNFTLKKTVLEDDVTAMFYADAADYDTRVSNVNNLYDERSSTFKIPVLFSRKWTTTTTRKSSFKELIKASKKK
ncbi:complement component C6-like, partial [Rhinoraja longicauda]